MIPEGRSLGSRIAHAAMWTTSSAVVVQAVRFGMFVLIARLVTPAQFGVVALALVLIELLQTLATTGMSDALVQKQDLTEEQADTVFWSTLGFGLVACLGVLLLAGPAAQLFDAPILAPVLQVMSLALLIWPIGAMHSARIARELGFKALAVRNIIAHLAGGGVGVAMALSGWGVWALVARSLVSLSCVVVFAWLKHPWRPKFRFSTTEAPGLLRTGSRLMASQVVSQLGGRGVELLAGLLLTPAAVGLLRVGGQCLDMLMQLSVMPFYQLALPSFSRSVQDGKIDPEIFTRLSRFSALLIFPTFFGAMTISHDVLPLLFGDRYATAGLIMAALCLMAVPLQLNLMLAPALTAVGRTDRVLLWSAIGAGLTLVFGGLGAALWGLAGLVLMTVARMYLTAPLGLLWLRRYGGIAIKDVLEAIRPPLLAAVGMALAAFGVNLALGQADVWVRLALTIATGVFAYGGLVLSLDRTLVSDLKGFAESRAAARAQASASAADRP